MTLNELANEKLGLSPEQVVAAREDHERRLDILMEAKTLGERAVGDIPPMTKAISEIGRFGDLCAGFDPVFSKRLFTYETYEIGDAYRRLQSLIGRGADIGSRTSLGVLEGALKDLQRLEMRVRITYLRRQELVGMFRRAAGK